MSDKAEQLARQKITRFVRRFDESYRLLAYYAAAPLVLTPELLNYLRNHFLRGQVPWIAEADLLLSELCEPVGYEQYTMESSVRACLLADMERQLGAEPLRHVARLLITHVNQLLQQPSTYSEQALRAERWSAMAYLSEQRDAVASEVATCFRDLLLPERHRQPDLSGLLGTAELTHLTQITERLAPALQDHPELLDYARAITALLFDDPQRLATLTDRAIVDEPEAGVQVANITLPRLDTDTDPPSGAKEQACFISFSHRDSEFVRYLHQALTARGVNAWLGNERGIADDLLDDETVEAIAASPYLLLCCSEASLGSKLVRREIQAARQAARQAKRDTRIIPLDLDGFVFASEDRLSSQLRRQLVLDFTGWQNDQEKLTGQLDKLVAILEGKSPEEESSFGEAERLLLTLDDPATDHSTRAKIGDQLAEIGDPRPGVGLNEHGLPEFVWLPVPGGRVVLDDEAGTFEVEPFNISRYLVTWAQYRAFLDAKDGYRAKRWWQELNKEAKPGRQEWKIANRPAENVSWYDAVAYCRWLSEKLGYEIRLPTEQEWQQAATGGERRQYPWGNEWQSNLANTLESEVGETTAVGMYPAGASPVGALDMAGNIWEWCLNRYEQPEDDRRSMTSADPRVVRGGSWIFDQLFARAAVRHWFHPAYRLNFLGLRVVSVSPIET